MADNKPTDGQQEKFVETKVLINPNMIANYWKKGEKPLFHFKRWRHLNLIAKDYAFIRVYRSLTTNQEFNIDEIIDSAGEESGSAAVRENREENERERKRRRIGELAKRARENFEILTEEEQSEFRWAHLNAVKAAESYPSLGLVGWADIESARSIEVFSVATKEKPDETNYRKTFHRIKFSIAERDKDAAGHLMHWTEKLSKYDDDDLGEDYLIAEMFVKEGALADLEKEVRTRGGNIPLYMRVEAHLFQYEVDESLAEPYHYQSYDMVYDSSNSIILNFIRIGVEPKVQPDNGDSKSGLDDEGQDEGPVSGTYLPRGILNAAAAIGGSLRQMRAAMWLIAVLLFLSLFA